VAPGQEQRAKTLVCGGREGKEEEEKKRRRMTTGENGMEWASIRYRYRCDAMQCSDEEQKEMRTRFDEMLYHIASLHLREGMRSNQNPS